MAEPLRIKVAVPRDLSKIKTKVLFSLTKRQLICFSLAALTGVPLFLALRKTIIGTSLSSLLMIVVMLPFFFLAMYEKNGLTLEMMLTNYIKAVFMKPQSRPYISEEDYARMLEAEEMKGKEARRRGRKTRKKNNCKSKKK